jgi:teichuronic acid biosynthesis glycosyltransferase TuaC
MRILMVASGNSLSGYGVNSFVYEQTLALRSKGIEVEIFPINGKGVSGYLKAALKLNKYVRKNHFDVVHGHFILSGIVSLMQFRCSVVVSFIGCDINIPSYRLLAKYLVIKRAKAIIFVSEKLKKMANFRRISYVLPYGVDLKKFFPIEKQYARRKLHWTEDVYHILFASSFDRIEKNSKLAFEAIEILREKAIYCKLIEFKNIKAEELNYYYNASDLFLMTSIREGSPQSLKEAMVCNVPAVLTDVGDVKQVTEGYIVSSFNPYDIADAIERVLAKKNLRTNGRERIINLKLDIESQTHKLLEIYESIVK